MSWWRAWFGQPEIVRLAPSSAHRWFEIGGPPEDLPVAIEAVAAALADTSRGVAMLVVAERAGTVVGRLEATLTLGGRLDVHPPAFRDGLSARARRKVAAAMLADVLAAAAHPAVRFVEMRCGDAGIGGEWVALAVAEGFQVAASARIYERDLGMAASSPVAAPPELRWRELAPDAEELETLFRLTHAGTADRVLRDSPEGTDALLARIMDHHAIDPSATRVLACAHAGLDAGLLIVGCERAPSGEAPNGWILTIGTAPAGRGQRIGAAMVGRALAVLADAGASCVLARIDVENAASIRLHEASGFVLRPGHHHTLWRAK